MKAEHAALALMTGLAYEVVVKLAQFLAPAVFHTSAATMFTGLMLRLILLAAVLFLWLFSREDLPRGWPRYVAWSMVGCLALRLVLRLPSSEIGRGVPLTRIVDATVGLLFLVLSLGLMLLYRRLVPAQARRLTQATTFLVVMQGLGVIPAVISLAAFVRFYVSGAEVVFPPQLPQAMIVVFLLTHAAMIAFLYCYARFKRASRSVATA